MERSVLEVLQYVSCLEHMHGLGSIMHKNCHSNEEVEEWAETFDLLLGEAPMWKQLISRVLTSLRHSVSNILQCRSGL